MRIFGRTLLPLTLLGAASLAAAQQHQHAAPAQGPDLAAMHCGGGMAAMMHKMPAGQHAAPGMRADSGMHTMMMGMMGPPAPAMLLNHKQQLGLTADQVSRLETLQKEAEPACLQHMQLGMSAHQEANRMLDAATPDFTAYTAKLKEATAHMAEGHVAMARAAVAARSLLTPAQQQSWKTLMQQMHKR